MAAVAGLIGSLVGLFVGAGYGGGLFVGVRAELMGALVGGLSGAGLGAAATYAGKWSHLVLRILYAILYCLFSLTTAAVWLFVNIMGDCFANEACIHHKRDAFFQTIALLAFYLALFVAFVAVPKWRTHRNR